MTGHKELAGAGSNAVKTINCGIANFDMPTCAHYYKSIMSRQLPARVEKMELAELVSGGTRLTGTLPIKKLPRLKPLVTNDKGAVDTRIEFFQNRNGLPAVRGYAIGEFVRDQFERRVRINTRRLLAAS